MPGKEQRGRTSITKSRPSKKASKPATAALQKTQAARPVKAGAGPKRGDRRDMNKTYTGTTKHSARGNTPRANVSTRKD